jgi:two-component system cell cycle response regulator
MIRERGRIIVNKTRIGGTMLAIDLILFLLLFILFVYIIATVTITNLHKIYLVFHVSMMIWPFCHFVIKIVDNERYQLFFLKAAFIDLSLLVVGWLIFVIFLTGQSRFLQKSVSLLIYLPALVAALGVLTNLGDIFVLPVNDGYVRRTYGPLFWYIIAILLGYMIASLFIIFRMLRTDISLRLQKQAKQVIKGIVLLFVFALLDIFFNVILADWLPIIPGLTSLGILISAIYFVIAIHRDKVFDLVTIAHQDIIDTIHHGILVLDENEIIVEMNKSLRLHVDLQIGDRFNIESLLLKETDISMLDSFLESYHNDPSENSKVEFIRDGDGQRFITIHAAPIKVKGTRVGQIITVQDVSEVCRLFEMTNLQNDLLQEQNQSLLTVRDELSQTNSKLEQLVVTDSLTGCYNRHYLTLQLEQRVVENMKHRISFAIILLDIDYFKLVNDQFGHLIGDEVIVNTVKIIKQSLRQTDILARYGGEEFMIYLPYTNQQQASILAEQVRSVIESTKIKAGKGQYAISITASMGLLSISNSGNDSLEDSTGYLKDLLATVDGDLYQAKKAGRNRIVSTFV